MVAASCTLAKYLQTAVSKLLKPGAGGPVKISCMSSVGLEACFGFTSAGSGPGRAVTEAVLYSSPAQVRAGQVHAAATARTSV